MKSVTVRVPASDLARAMVLMREWLDLNRCEPTSFDCGTSLRFSVPPPQFGGRRPEARVRPRRAPL